MVMDGFRNPQYTGQPLGNIMFPGGYIQGMPQMAQMGVPHQDDAGPRRRAAADGADDPGAPAEEGCEAQGDVHAPGLRKGVRVAAGPRQARSQVPQRRGTAFRVHARRVREEVLRAQAPRRARAHAHGREALRVHLPGMRQALPRQERPGLSPQGAAQLRGLAEMRRGGMQVHHAQARGARRAQASAPAARG